MTQDKLVEIVTDLGLIRGWVHAQYAQACGRAVERVPVENPAFEGAQEAYNHAWAEGIARFERGEDIDGGAAVTYRAWDRVEIVDKFLPRGTVTAVLADGSVVVQPDGRSYTLKLFPEDIRLLDT